MSLTRKWLASVLTLAAGTVPMFAAGQAPTDPQIPSLVTVDASPAGKRQVIDGFGTALNEFSREEWVQSLYLDDLQGSIARWDTTPQFASPYSDSVYYTPWFGSQIPFPGPDGNNARTYSGPSDYSRPYGGFRAPIAVMGPDIDANVAKFDFNAQRPGSAGAFARAMLQRKAQLGDVKIIGTTFSPAPWVKVASGHTYDQGSGVLPTIHTPFPFVWNGQFGGGNLDVSGTPLEVFNDGTGPTSALTQYARSTAAYLRGWQRTYGFPLYAVSIQNEPNFEQFFDSCNYQTTPPFAAAVKALRAELDKYPDLKTIRLIGPEDLLIDTPYALWQFGGGVDTVHKNLRYLHEMKLSDPVALAGLDFVALHASVNDETWGWWANGWQATPTGTLPSRLDGFLAYGKKSWMTETSGGDQVWPTPGAGQAESGALGTAIHIHRALTTGQQSAWLHWQFTDQDAAGAMTLTDKTLGANAPKYVALKHFAKTIRPNATRAEAQVADAPGLLASAYVHEQNRTVTVVLINTATEPRTTRVQLSGAAGNVASYTSYSTSAAASYQSGTAAVTNGIAQITVPAYGIVTLQGAIAQTPTQPPERPCTGWRRRFGLCD